MATPPVLVPQRFHRPIKKPLSGWRLRGVSCCLILNLLHTVFSRQSALLLKSTVWHYPWRCGFPFRGFTGTDKSLVNIFTSLSKLLYDIPPTKSTTRPAISDMLKI